MELVKKVWIVIAVLTVISIAAGQDDIKDLAAYYGFGEMEIVKLEWDVRNLRMGDFNKDGRNDIAIVNNRKARIELLLQKEAIGPGEVMVTVDANEADINAVFDSLPTRFKKESVAVSQNIYSLACGDLDNDGLVDLAFYGEPKGLYIMLQKPSETKDEKSKGLSWRTKKKISIDDGLSTSNALVCADLNKDKRLDLALAANDGVYIIEQKDDGTLAEPVKFPCTERIMDLKVGDVNGDKLNDLVLVVSESEKPLRIRFGLKTGQLGPERQYFIERPFQMRLQDVDGKEGEEVLIIDAHSGRLICYKFDSSGEKDTDWPILFFPIVKGESDSLRDLVTGDFDGDKLADVVIGDGASAQLIFYKQRPEYGLTEPVMFPTLADISSLSAEDIDGDGKTEIAVLSVKEKLIGISRFEDERLSFPKPLDLAGEPLAMELADADGDKRMDCVYISKSADNIRFLRVAHSIGKASRDSKRSGESEAEEPAVELKKLTSNPSGLKVLDVDQDGLQDVIVFVKYESPILIRQIQKGKFEVIDSPSAQASLIKDASLTSIAVSNVDGKKGEELLIAQKNFARGLIFEGSEKWTIVDQYNAKNTENTLSAVAAFDIGAGKSKGQPEIFLLDSRKGQLQMLTAGEDKTYRFEKEINVGRWEPAEHLKILYAPLSGRKSGNIVLFDGKKFAVITPQLDGKGFEDFEQLFSYETKIKDGSYGNLTAGDINSDGLPDIVMVDYKNNNMEILALDKQKKPVPAMRFKIFEEKSYSEERPKTGVEPRELQISDVTGDGKADLVTVIHDRIIVYPQD